MQYFLDKVGHPYMVVKKLTQEESFLTKQFINHINSVWWWFIYKWGRTNNKNTAIAYTKDFRILKPKTNTRDWLIKKKTCCHHQTLWEKLQLGLFLIIIYFLLSYYLSISVGFSYYWVVYINYISVLIIVGFQHDWRGWFKILVLLIQHIL
jgi:hypothetical protein